MRHHRSPRIGGVFDWFRRKEPGRRAPPPIQPAPGVDYYAVLAVPPTASMDEIRAAYRRRAAPLHPDRRPGDPEAARLFQQLSEAYQILSNPDWRTAYDRLRAAGPPRPPPAPPPPPETALAPRPPMPPAAPSMFAAFETRRGVAPPKPTTFAPGRPAPAGPPVRKATLWETMFLPPPEERREPPRPGAIFAPFAPRPVAPSGMPVVPRVPEPTPPMIEGLAEWLDFAWPLDFVWDMVRTYRQAPEFRASGLMIIDRVAGFDPRIGVEYELAEALAIPPSIVDDYSRRGLLTTGLWRDVFHPVFGGVTAALDMLKPRDIPGRFVLDWDPQGTGIDLLYFEETGRRPWK